VTDLLCVCQKRAKSILRPATNINSSFPKFAKKIRYRPLFPKNAENVGPDDDPG
jgi:hypothetical protein